MASKPFYQVADRILGSQFLEDIAEFFILFQTMYAGFVERAEARRPALLHDKRTTFIVVSHARGGAAARGRVLHRRARRQAASTSAPSCSTRCCPRTCSTTRRAASPSAWPGRRRAGRAADVARRASATRPTSTACSARSARTSSTTRSSPSARPSSAPSWPPPPRSSPPCPYFDDRHLRPRRSAAPRRVDLVAGALNRAGPMTRTVVPRRSRPTSRPHVAAVGGAGQGHRGDPRHGQIRG